VTLRRSDAEVAKWCRENPQRPFCENDGEPCPMSEECAYRQIHLSYTRRFPDLYDRREMLSAMITGAMVAAVVCALVAVIAMIAAISSH
jgi:hypothetical protein